MNRRSFLAAAAAVPVAFAAPAFALDGTVVRFSGDGGVALDARTLGSGPPLVFVPGGPGFAAHYLDDVAEKLTGVEAVLFDPRGTGASEALPPRPDLFTIAHAAEDIEALRRTLGADRIGVLGHSFGGFLAMAYQVRHPNRVSRLVLVDSAPPDLAATEREMNAALLARLDANARADIRAQRRDSGSDPEAADRATMLALLPALFANPANAARMRPYIAQEEYYSPSASLAFRNDLERHGRVAPAPATSTPVEIIFGAEDPSRAASLPGLRARYPHATVDIVPHAGHFPWMESPTAFFAALRGFIARTG